MRDEEALWPDLKGSRCLLPLPVRNASLLAGSGSGRRLTSGAGALWDHLIWWPLEDWPSLVLIARRCIISGQLGRARGGPAIIIRPDMGDLALSQQAIEPAGRLSDKSRLATRSGPFFMADSQAFPLISFLLGPPPPLPLLVPLPAQPT